MFNVSCSGIKFCNFWQSLEMQKFHQLYFNFLSLTSALNFLACRPTLIRSSGKFNWKCKILQEPIYHRGGFIGPPLIYKLPKRLGLTSNLEKISRNSIGQRNWLLLGDWLSMNLDIFLVSFLILMSFSKENWYFHVEDHLHLKEIYYRKLSHIKTDSEATYYFEIIKTR